MTSRRAGRRLRATATAAAVIGFVALGAPSAHAVDDTSGIAHVDLRDGQLRVLVDVPASAEADLDDVILSLDDASLDAAARPAGGDTLVRRTTVLVVDTSDSMEGDRFTAAKDAARTFVDSVPDDVRVGIVSFDGQVTSALAPTTDRADALATIDQLQLDRGTLLHDGVITALKDSGRDGERTLVVLSDGADTSDTPLDKVTNRVERSGVTVQVVALDQTGAALTALEDLAAAGDGLVVQADPEALTSAFTEEAEVLARQVLVTASLPEGVEAGQATVRVELPTSAATVTGSALVQVPGPAETDTGIAAAPTADQPAGDQPRWMMWAGVGAVAIGLFVAVALVAPGREKSLTAEERVAAYADAVRRHKQPDPIKTGHRAETTLPTALGAMKGVLERNQQLEDKISRTLTAAGSSLKPSEWLLVHVAIVVISGFAGYFLGGGSIVLGLLFLLAGGIVPRLYLAWRARRRRKKFGRLLPDVLQLLSGSLAAGLSLMQSVDTIVREGQEPVRSEFKRVLVETRLGVPLEDALEGIAARFDSQDWAWVVMAIRIQRSVGGNLAELLDSVGVTIREREYLRRQVAALSAEGKLSAYILTALPPGIVSFLLITKGEFMRPMVEQPLGIIMLVGATMWLCVGGFWMSRMVNVEV